jgi:hypothetical protein
MAAATLNHHELKTLVSLQQRFDSHREATISSIFSMPCTPAFKRS